MEDFPKIESKEANNGIILEVGCGKRTVVGFEGRYKDKLLEGNHIFVALDRDSNKLYELKSEANTQGIRDVQDKVLVVNADGKNIPLHENSVDEVILQNVFGDTHVNYPANPRARPILQILESINQVLKKHGKLVIIETLTPDYAKGEGFSRDSDLDYKKILENFPDLKLIEYSSDLERIKHYTGRKVSGYSYPFVAVYEKEPRTANNLS